MISGKRRELETRKGRWIANEERRERGVEGRLTLLFDAAVPPEVNADDFRSHCEVEADAAGFERGDHDFAGVVVLEIDEGGDLEKRKR